MQPANQTRLLRLIFALYNLGVVILPLTFLFSTDELFEFNKILLVYLWAILAGGLWLAKLILTPNREKKRWSGPIWSSLYWVLILWLGSQLLATLFSLHPYTSLFGYYSRFNGGLLSTLAYAVLTVVFINTWAKLKPRALWIWLGFLALGNALAALYAFPEHFGFSPSCWLTSGQLSVDCWIQDVQNRVFGTFGQPNWLAAYLVLLLPLWLSLLWLYPNWKNRVKRVPTWLLGVALASLSWLSFLVLLYTKSRSGLLGLAVGLTVSLLLTGWLAHKQTKTKKRACFKLVVISLGLALLTLLSVGTPLTPSLKEMVNRETKTAMVSSPPPPVSEGGGTESGEIRKLVWQGALAVWRRAPLLGTGVETFAYSFYRDRPREHNFVSEWDFLYNKAHNEWLNSLANTGLIGTGTYALLVIWPYWIGFRLSRRMKVAQKEPSELSLVPGLLGGLTALHLSNFFGFATVTVSLLHLLFTALMAIIWWQSEVRREREESEPLSPQSNSTITLNELSWGRKLALLMLCLLCLLGGKQIYSIWRADQAFATGKSLIAKWELQAGSEQLLAAIERRPREALYYSTLGSAYTEVATQLMLQASESSELTSLQTQLQELATKAASLLVFADTLNHNHYSLLLRKISAFTKLGLIDEAYLHTALSDLERAKQLSPQDPRPHWLRAPILQYLGQTEEANQEQAQGDALMTPNSAH